MVGDPVQDPEPVGDGARAALLHVQVLAVLGEHGTCQRIHQGLTTRHQVQRARFGVKRDDVPAGTQGSDVRNS